MLQKRKLLPPLDYLLAFEAAATACSFARASEALNISETAISRKVRLLEQHYNVALFVRGHRSITLTPQGAALLSSVSRAIGTRKNRVSNRRAGPIGVTKRATSCTVERSSRCP